MTETKFPINKNKQDLIGTPLKNQFFETEKQRMLFWEEEWLSAIRQLKGIYDPDVLKRIQTGRSRVYPRYTRSKVIPVTAKLNNLVFPDNDRNFTIKPTPEPKLGEEQINEIVASIKLEDESGELREITNEIISEAVMLFAKNKAEKMMTTMDDQLVEAGYIPVAKRMVKGGVILGTGVIKGPLSKGHMKRKVISSGGKYTQTEKKEFRPFVDNVSLWTWFPDMSSTELENCDFVYELHIMSKHEVRKLAKTKNFDKDVINEYLRTHKEGDHQVRQWELDLQNIQEEEVTHNTTHKYDVLERNGYLDGQDLISAGIIDEEEDPNKDWFVNVWILGDKVIKAKVHPKPFEKLTDLYHMFYFEKDDSSIFGEGVPRIIKDTQISICSAVRAMLDNAAWGAGPIVEVSSDLFGDEDIDNIHPGRSYEREDTGASLQYQAIRLHRVDIQTDKYLAIMDKFERIGDMESSLPAFLSGEAAKTTNETSKGISIRASNTELTIHDIVKNFDEANESFLKILYQWNMAHNPDESIKGDMQIRAIGSSSLVSKEVRTQALDQFNQQLSPEEKPYIKTREMLVERARMHDLDPDKLIHTDQEAQANIERQRDSEMIQLEKARLQADIDYDNAKAANMNSKATSNTKETEIKETDSLVNNLKTVKEVKSGERGTE